MNGLCTPFPAQEPEDPEDDDIIADELPEPEASELPEPEASEPPGPEAPEAPDEDIVIDDIVTDDIVTDDIVTDDFAPFTWHIDVPPIVEGWCEGTS